MSNLMFQELYQMFWGLRTESERSVKGRVESGQEQSVVISDHDGPKIKEWRKGDKYRDVSK